MKDTLFLTARPPCPFVDFDMGDVSAALAAIAIGLFSFSKMIVVFLSPFFQDVSFL